MNAQSKASNRLPSLHPTTLPAIPQSRPSYLPTSLLRTYVVFLSTMLDTAGRMLLIHLNIAVLDPGLTANFPFRAHIQGLANQGSGGWKRPLGGRING